MLGYGPGRQTLQSHVYVPVGVCAGAPLTGRQTDGGQESNPADQQATFTLDT